jgi:hypothetical protein
MNNPTGFLLPEAANALRQAFPPKPLPGLPPEAASKYRWLNPLSDAVLLGVWLMSAVGIIYVLFNGSL